jgi:hypothetical protein
MRQDRRRTWSTYGTYLNDKIAVLEIVVGVACRRRGSTGRLWNGCVNRLCIRGEVVHSGHCKERILEVDCFQLARSAEGSCGNNVSTMRFNSDLARPFDLIPARHRMLPSLRLGVFLSDMGAEKAKCLCMKLIATYCTPYTYRTKSAEQSFSVKKLCQTIMMGAHLFLHPYRHHPPSSTHINHPCLNYGD